jgi:hypothetical protein
VRTPDFLEVTVLDDGGGQAEAADGTASTGNTGNGGGGAGAGGGGHGLMGMRERVAALHGVCEAAPRPEGGFQVRVELPLQARTEADGHDRGGGRTRVGSRAHGGGQAHGGGDVRGGGDARDRPGADAPGRRGGES